MENKTLNRETYAIIKSSLFPYTSIHNTHPDTQTDYYQNQNLFINVFEAISLRARAPERTRRIHRFMVWLKLLNSKRLLMAPKTKSTLFQWTEMNQDFLEPIEDDNNCCGNQHFWYEMRQDNGRKKRSWKTALIDCTHSATIPIFVLMQCIAFSNEICVSVQGTSYLSFSSII